MASVTALPMSHAPLNTVPKGQDHLDGLPSPELKSHPEHAPNPHGPVDATLYFFEAPKDGSAPYNYVEPQPEGTPQRNFGAEEHQVQIKDIRGHEKEYSLEVNSIAALQGYPHNEKIDWNDEASIEKHYYPEVERILLENVPGAQKVTIFDHTIRRPEPGAKRGPVTRCHIDQTPWSAANRVRRHAANEAEAEEQLNGRYRIINVWRPLNGKVVALPLAFADARTVGEHDVVPVEHRYPTWSGQTAAVAFKERQQWLYWSQMDNDERILLQCSDNTAPLTRLPHTAFVDPRTQENWKGRESIEVRCLVFG